jgi:hypothetical protein
MKKLFPVMKKILFRAGVASLAVNIVLLVYSAASGKSYFTVPRIERRGAEPYLAAACIVSLPLPDYDGPALSFGTISLTLRQGDTAYLQFSTLKYNRQTNKTFQYRCDRTVVEVTTDNGRAAIKALSTGETMLEALTEGGVIPVCLVTVERPL